jgi:peptidoglycan/LPS O-acetylase OafA/YrhL
MSAAFGAAGDATVAWPRAIGRSATRRDAGLDALRAALTLLVVFHHAAHSYSGLSGWYYSESHPEGALGAGLLRLFLLINQAWFMGLFFLIAGYFTPVAVERRSVSAYLRGRALRLGLPLLLYRFVLSPITVALALTAEGRPFLATLPRIANDGAYESGPLWFLEALLVFALAYCGWRAAASRMRGTPGRAKPLAFPSNAALATAVLATGLAAFVLRLVWPVGAQVGGLQLGNFASYAVLFAAGCAGASSRWVGAVPTAQRRLWLAVALLALPLLPIAGLFAPAASGSHGNMQGGWNVMAAAYAFWEPLVGLGFILTLIHAFERRFVSLGAIWAALARRAYAIYIIHPPVLAAIAIAWRDLAAPPLVKFAVTGAATSIVCFWVAGLLLRAPSIRRIL